MNRPIDPIDPADEALDELLGQLGNPAGSTPRAHAAHILGLAAPAAVAAPVAAGITKGWLAGAVAAALAAGFVGGVVVTRATSGERIGSEPMYGVAAEAGVAAEVGLGEEAGVTADGSAAARGGVPAAAGVRAAAAAPVAGGGAAGGEARAELAPAAAARVGNGHVRRIAGITGDSLLDEVPSREEPVAETTGGADASRAPVTGAVASGDPADVGAVAAADDGVGKRVQTGDDPADDAPTADDATAEDGTATEDDLVAEGNPDESRVDREDARAAREPADEHRPADRRPALRRGVDDLDAVATRDRPGRSPWSLAFDGGGLWASVPSRRSLGLDPGRVATSGAVGQISARVSTRGDGLVSLTGEAGFSLLAGLTPAVGPVMFSPGGAVELGVHASPTLTPSLGWTVAGRVVIPGTARPSDGDALVLATGPTLGLDVGRRDRPHLRLRLDVDGVPERFATEGLVPTVSLTAGVEVPLGTW